MVAQKLQTLDLSFNPLGDGASYSLASCLQHLPSLRGLFIEACELTDRSLESQLSAVLRTRALTQIGIGWNSLQYKLKPWLETFDWTRLERLSLKGLQNSKTVNIFITCLQATERTQIAELDLSNCSVTESCVRALSEAIHRLPVLKRLILKNNIKLQINALELILAACQTNCIYIEEIDLTGCALGYATPDSDPAAALQLFLDWSTSLHRLSLSFNPRRSDARWIPSITDTWSTGHSGDCQASRVTEHHLILSTCKS